VGEEVGVSDGVGVGVGVSLGVVFVVVVGVVVDGVGVGVEEEEEVVGIGVDVVEGGSLVDDAAGVLFVEESTMLDEFVGTADMVNRGFAGTFDLGRCLA
jgi:hypothetical protein